MKANPEIKRSVRLADRIRAELQDIFSRGSVRDPDAQGAIVSAVRVTDDLRLARVNIRLLASEVTDDRKKRVVAAMKRARGLLRRELASALQLKHTPELEFFWDSGTDHALRMDEIFDEIARERNEK